MAILVLDIFLGKSVSMYINTSDSSDFRELKFALCCSSFTGKLQTTITQPLYFNRIWKDPTLRCADDENQEYAKM